MTSEGNKNLIFWAAYLSFPPIYFSSHTPLVQLLSRGLSMTFDEMNRIVPVLSVFCSMFCSSILTLHDAEFFGENEGRFVRFHLHCLLDVH
jgi:hypothetical protein